MHIHRTLYHLGITGMLLALLAACGGAPEPATEAPTQASTPTAEPAEPTKGSTAPAEPSETSAPSAPDTGAAGTSSTYVADLGFRPEVNGFGFANYGGEGETNLMPDDLRRMFGDKVCAAIEGDQCLLTPPGEQWLQQINNDMSGGHCEGMAVLSNLFYTGKAKPADFGADSVPALELADNEPLQREIAYWWATQATNPARTGIVEQTPSGVINTLLTAFAAGPSGSNQYAVGFYKRDRTGGHAVTPYAIEDRGDGLYSIMVYDNNYPGEARAIEVDTNADTWRYTGSTNPAEEADEYEGDAESLTLELAPIAPRLELQECPFCDEPGAAQAGGRQLAPTRQANQVQYNQVWLDGEADLLITDAQGRRVGFLDGTFINEIPGATSNGNKYGVNVWNIDAEPVYNIPASIDFTISIDGSRLTAPSNSTITMIGPGYALEVSDIVLEPGQVDTLDVAPDGSLLAYRTESGETPFLLVAIETSAADYLFGVYGEELAPGEALNLALDTTQGWLSIDAIDNSAPGSYGLIVAKYDDQGEQVFGAEGVALDPDDVAYIDYLAWPGNGQPMTLEVDRGGDGNVDETLEVADVTDEVKE